MGIASSNYHVRALCWHADALPCDIDRRRRDERYFSQRVLCVCNCGGPRTGHTPPGQHKVLSTRPRLGYSFLSLSVRSCSRLPLFMRPPATRRRIGRRNACVGLAAHTRYCGYTLRSVPWLLHGAASEHEPRSRRLEQWQQPVDHFAQLPLTQRVAVETNSAREHEQPATGLGAIEVG